MLLMEHCDLRHLLGFGLMGGLGVGGLGLLKWMASGCFSSLTATISQSWPQGSTGSRLSGFPRAIWEQMLLASWTVGAAWDSVWQSITPGSQAVLHLMASINPWCLADHWGLC